MVPPGQFGAIVFSKSRVLRARRSSLVNDQHVALVQSILNGGAALVGLISARRPPTASARTANVSHLGILRVH